MSSRSGTRIELVPRCLRRKRGLCSCRPPFHPANDLSYTACSLPSHDTHSDIPLGLFFVSCVCRLGPCILHLVTGAPSVGGVKQKRRRRARTSRRRRSLRGRGGSSGLSPRLGSRKGRRDIRGKLSPHEVDFLREYHSSIMDFRSDFSDELDIMASITQPPKDLHVLVKVVRDCGEIQTELGNINFKNGERFMVSRADIEHLIVQGYLEEV
ncbi:GINS complex Psf1 component [Lyophyllum atratum]|nr:GINS complex Psf1 component [Lyophyllum atratum]